MTFMKEHLKENNQYDIPEKEYKEVRSAILNQEVLPSMRALMTSGKALERSNIAGYNCSYLPIDSPRSFDELLYILMNGTGVGYSVESKYVNQLPIVNEHFEQTDSTLVVADSKEGWARSLRELIALLYSGQIPKWDLSRVRPAGERLKIFGGRASGPDPLDELFHYTVEMFTKASGRKLTTLEAHDLCCKIASVVVVGGVRRSALISLSDLDDHRMRTSKSGQWWDVADERALANNSAVYESKPPIDQFMEEWLSLIQSKSGERGLFNREANRTQASKYGLRDKDIEYSTNPCCLAPDTTIMTSTGPRKISEIDSEFIAVVDGKEYQAKKPWISGVGQVYKLSTKEGYEIELTPEHRIMTESRGWQEVQNLEIGEKINLANHKDISWGSSSNEEEGYVLGQFIGDGNFSNQGKTLCGQDKYVAYCKLWDYEGDDSEAAKVIYSVAKELPHRSDWNGWSKPKQNPWHISITPLTNKYNIRLGSKTDIKHLEEESSAFSIGLIRGLFDSDGHVEQWQDTDDYKGLSVRLSSIDYEMLQSVQRMLLRLGILSRIYLQRESGKSELPDGKGGSKLFETKDCYRLVVSAESVSKFAEKIGFLHKEKSRKLNDSVAKRSFYKKPFTATVSSFDYVKESEVWDTEVEEVHAFDANGIYAHNSEIILRPYQFCNLSTVIVREEDDMKSLKRKIKLATILGTWQSTLTNFKYLRKIWQKNTEEERLLGVSMTGQFGNKLLNGVEEGLEDRLDELRVTSRKVNEKLAPEIGIPVSASTTAVKPEGTTSQLTLTSSGLHPWYSEYYIRTVRSDVKDPLTQFLKDQGVPNEPERMSPEATTVFSFPIKAPNGSITRDDISSIEHLELWLKYQRHYCEHKPSVTIYVKEEDWLDVGAWVYKNFDEISGVSFLPHSDHTYEQAPYQEITKEQYEAAVEKMPKEIYWQGLKMYEVEDSTTGTQELACVAGNCDI